jgi:hypothetical protein
MSLNSKVFVEGVKRRPLVCTCGVVLVALAIVIYFRAGVATELRSRLEAQEKEFARLSNNVKFSAQLDAQLEALKKANATIEAGTLRAGELARNQQVFLRLLPETGVKLVDLIQTPTAKAQVPAAKGAPVVALTTYSPLAFNVTVQGDYAQLIDFMKRLERGPTLSRVTSGRIASPVEGAQTLTLGVELLGFRS